MNEMKSGKAPRLDEFPLECLKKGGMTVLERLIILWCMDCRYLWTGVTNVNAASLELLVC